MGIPQRGLAFYTKRVVTRQRVSVKALNLMSTGENGTEDEPFTALWHNRAATLLRQSQEEYGEQAPEEVARGNFQRCYSLLSMGSRPMEGYGVAKILREGEWSKVHWRQTP